MEELCLAGVSKFLRDNFDHLQSSLSAVNSNFLLEKNPVIRSVRTSAKQTNFEDVEYATHRRSLEWYRITIDSFVG